MTPPLLLDEPSLWLRVERSGVKVSVRSVTSVMSLLCSGRWVVNNPSMLQMVQNRVHLVLKSDSLSLCPCSTDMVVDLNLAWRSNCSLSQLQVGTWLLPALREVGCTSVLIRHLLIRRLELLLPRHRHEVGLLLLSLKCPRLLELLPHSAVDFPNELEQLELDSLKLQ